MKTNIKRAINILLSVAMLVTLVAALSATSLAAAPVLSEGMGAIAGDKISLQFKLTGDADTMASLRVQSYDAASNEYLYLNQLTLKSGKNDIDFPVDTAKITVGTPIKMTVASAVGEGTIVVVLGSGNVDRDALTAAIKSAEQSQPKCVEADKAKLQTAIDNAKAALETAATQQEIDDAVTALKAAVADCKFGTTGVTFEAGAMVVVPRGGKIGPYDATGVFGGGQAGAETDIIWIIGNTTLLKANTDGSFTALAKTGTCTLTAYDQNSKLSYSIVVKVT